jgi:hypothetical protein
MVAVALALAIAVATVVRYWSLPTGISLLLRHGGPPELLFELVLPLLVPVVLLIAAFLMIARIRAGRVLAIVGAGLVLVAPVAVTAVVGHWPDPGSTANTVLLYLSMVLAVALVVLAAIPVTGIYLRSQDLST